MEEAFNWGYLLLPLIVIVDVMAIVQILRSKHFSALGRGVIILIIILIPILGVSISYLLLLGEMRKKEVMHNTD